MNRIPITRTGWLLWGAFLCTAALASPARAEPSYPPPPPPPAWPTEAAPCRAPTGLAERPSSPLHVPPGPAVPIDTVYRRVHDPLSIARGPVEIRDEFLLAQPHLTLPYVGPDALACGRWLVRLHFDIGNDFGFDQTGPAEDPTADVRFLVDGERYTLEAQARRGLAPGLDAGIRVPVRWRGGGFLDDFIESWHETFGLLNNSREVFFQDSFRVEGRDDAMNAISWSDEKGWGLGNVELDVRWQFLRPSCRSSWRAAWVARVGLPTGTGPYETKGVDLGLQAVAAKQVARGVDLYGGLGGTWFSDDELRGVEYEALRGHAFFVVEWRPFTFMSLLLQTDVSSRLVTNLASYPGVQWYLLLGGKFDLGNGWRFTLGITENLKDQQSTIDVGAWAAIEVEF